MSEEKIFCPLLSLNSPKGLCECIEKSCAWYVNGECALVALLRTIEDLSETIEDLQIGLTEDRDE